MFSKCVFRSFSFTLLVLLIILLCDTFYCHSLRTAVSSIYEDNISGADASDEEDNSESDNSQSNEESVRLTKASDSLTDTRRLQDQHRHHEDDNYHSHKEEKENETRDEEADSIKSCPACKAASKQSKQLSPQAEEDVNEARLEYIKNQILHKLGMNSAPMKGKRNLDFPSCKFHNFCLHLFSSLD